MTIKNFQRKENIVRLFLISLSISSFLFKINAQNVGVGTLTPSAKLHVQGNVNEVVRFDGIEPFISWYVGSNHRGSIQSNNNEDFLIYNYGSGSIVLRNTGAVRVLIDNLGNVGIGITTPTELLHVAGSFRLEAGFYDATNSSGLSGYLLKSTGSGTEWVDPLTVSGLQGATGPQGLQGTQGITGPTGIQGLQGTQGITGPTGAQGTTGPSGSFAAVGSTGQTLYYNGSSWTATSNLFNDSSKVGIGTVTPTAMLHLENPSSGSGPNLLYANDFDSEPVGNISYSTSSDPYQTDMNVNCIAGDSWRISATDADGTSCTNCSSNRAVIDFGSISCEQYATLILGQFPAPMDSIYIRFAYGYDDYSVVDNLTVLLYNETTNAVHSTLLNVTSDCDNCYYADYAVGLTVGDLYTLRFRYEGSYDYGATVDAVLITYSTSSNELLRIVDGNEASGKVLTSDADGNASWQAPSGGGGGGGTYTFTNGLTESSGTAKLGGALINSTLITLGNNDLTFDGSGATGPIAGELKIEGDTRIIMETEVYDDYVSFGGGYVSVDSDDGTSFTDSGGDVYTIDFALGVDVGTSGGSAFQMGSIEYMVDGLAELLINHDLNPIDDGSIDLGGSTKRWDDIYATSGVINTSDITLKENIKSLDYGLNEIMKLKPISYVWKKNRIGETVIPDDLKEVHLGFSAQDLIQVIPEVVKTHDWKVTDEKNRNKFAYVKNQNLGVNYSKIIPVTVKAIQEQQTIIDKLQLNLEILKKEQELLKKELEEMRKQLKE